MTSIDLRLDGAKPHNFDTYVMTRDVGRHIERPSLRVARVPLVQLPELLDAVVYAVSDLEDAQGGEKGAGPQVSLRAILALVGRTNEEHRGAIEAALDAQERGIMSHATPNPKGGTNPMTTALTIDDPEIVAEATARVKRYAAAKAEADALKQWQSNPKGERPATPNLNSIQEGITMTKSTKSTSKGAGRITPEPITKAGTTTVQFAKGRQVEIITPVVAKIDGASVEQWSLLITPKAAQAVVDALVSYTEQESLPYPTRMGVLTTVAVRKAFPKATTTSTAPIMQLVTALNDAGHEWGYDVQADSTLRVWYKVGDKRHDGSVREHLDRLDVKAPAKAVAPKKVTTPKAKAKGDTTKAQTTRAAAAKAIADRRAAKSTPKDVVMTNFKTARAKTVAKAS